MISEKSEKFDRKIDNWKKMILKKES